MCVCVYRSLERVRSNDFIKPSDILRLMKQPKRKAREAVRAADYFEQTLRIISEKTHHAHKRSINATGLTRMHTSLHMILIYFFNIANAPWNSYGFKTTTSYNSYQLERVTPNTSFIKTHEGIHELKSALRPFQHTQAHRWLLMIGYCCCDCPPFLCINGIQFLTVFCLTLTYSFCVEVYREEIRECYLATFFVMLMECPYQYSKKNVCASVFTMSICSVS